MSDLYDAAKQTYHECGLPWIDPRTGKVHQSPRKFRRPKLRKVRVNYKVTLTEPEFKALVRLGKSWDYVGTPLQIAKKALQNSGDSGCLAQLKDYMK